MRPEASGSGGCEKPPAACGRGMAACAVPRAVRGDPEGGWRRCQGSSPEVLAPGVILAGLHPLLRLLDGRVACVCKRGLGD